MNTASKEKLVAVLRAGNVRLWNRYVAWCRRHDGWWRADLRGADLRGADLRGADLHGADMDFSCWPLCCGGTMAKIDRLISLQLIYHAFNQAHHDADVRGALEHLRPLAQEFIDEYRNDAPMLRDRVQP